MQQTIRFYTLAMLTDKGWRFLDEDLISLHSGPLRAVNFELDYIEALRSAHWITDTEYHVEPVLVKVDVEIEFPKEVLKRREGA